MALSSTGNQEALGALYDRYSSRVYSLAMLLLGDQSEAQEVTQDVFLAVWRHSRGFDPLRARFSTWITRIAHNRAVDELRKRRKRSKDTPLGEVSANNHAALQSAMSLDTNLELGRVGYAVDGLSPEHQRVIFLSYYQGYTHKEISGILGQPLGTVKTHMRAALKKLRESLAAPVGGER
jgi:RNA polymerase sigma-70 factor (ECF subfamily)